MPADSYGIVVEGEYDSAAYAAIIQKLASHAVYIKPFPCGGKPKLIQKFPGYLNALKYELTGRHVDTAIVIVDSDGQDPGKLEAVLRAKVAGREYRFELHFYAVSCTLETWLLADIEAIARVVQQRTGRNIRRPQHNNLERLIDPKPAFRAILTEGRVDYTAAVAAEIAREIDLQILSARCPRFQRFAELVDC
jgi:hypothetical protein